jgi:hypothetical protein
MSSSLLTEPNTFDLATVLHDIEFVVTERLAEPLDRYDDPDHMARVVLAATAKVLRAHADPGTPLGLTPYLRASLAASVCLRYLAAHDPPLRELRAREGLRPACAQAARRLRSDERLAAARDAAAAIRDVAIHNEALTGVLIEDLPLTAERREHALGVVRELAVALTQVARVAPHYALAAEPAA